MTTKVIISSPVKNHENLRVHIESQRSDGSWVRTYYADLTDGENAVEYVHGYQRMIIEEIPKSFAASRRRNSEDIHD